jgi:dolichol-phosphate mannosyltransferase
MIHLLILTHNDQDTLPPFLAAVQVASSEWDQSYQAVVVDRGSTDETADIVQDFGTFELCRQQEPVGEGIALKIGLDRILEKAAPADIVVTLDARITHSPALVKTMLPVLTQGSAVVLASRFMKGGAELGLTTFESTLNRTSSLLIRWLCPISGVQDHTNRCRAHRAKVLLDSVSIYRDQIIQEQDAACWLEILFKLAKQEGIQFGQVPQVVRYDLQPKPEQDGIWHHIRRQIHLISRGRCYR